ncbi:MAG: hypothetical protein J5506_02320 [Prevotella sp.]|nr:hypothetical protein [Prevotella sp.]
MMTKTYKRLLTGLSFIICHLSFSVALTACSPESFDGPDQNGIPSISGVDIDMNVDQTVNQATFKVTNMPPATYALWVVNGSMYSTLNPMSWANNKAGTYDVELRLGNRNGFSQGSISKTFTFDNSQVDLTPYITRISRTWRINYAEQGHMGCGEPGTDGSNWWSAAPNDKADWGVYDDRLTFDANGGYTYDPGDGGTVYVNNGCSLFPEYNTLVQDDGSKIDFTAPVDVQNASYHFDVDGDKIVLRLSPNTLFPYISSDDQYANPVFTVTKLTNSEMELLYEGNGITWRFMLTSKEDGNAPFMGFKAKSEFNMWRDITPVMTGYYNPDPGWGNEQTPAFESLFKLGNNDYDVTIPQECFAEWQAQVHFHTNLSTSAANHYDFSVILSTDRDIDGVVIKLTNEDDSESIIDEHNVNLKAGEDYVFWKSDLEGKDLSPVKLVFDFGHATGETHVNIKNIVLKDHANDDGTVLPDPNGGGEEVKADWDYASGANMWKAVDDGSMFDAFGYYFAAGDDWHGISYEEATHNGDTYELTLPADLGKNQWQGQFHIDTKLTASASKTYNFYLVMEADNDCPQVTFKLTDSGDSNYFFEERNDVPAGTYVFKRTGLTLKEGQDATAIRLFFDFGGSPGGTHVKISKIYLEEAVSMNYDDADNLWKAVDDGSMLAGLGYYFASGDDWHAIDYTEATHNGDTYELTLPADLGKNQWQGQFHIDTKLTASAAKQYNFQLVMEADNDCPQVTIKLTDAGDTNYFCESRHDIPAGEPYVFTLKGATLKEGQDADAIRLFFDFGGSPGGTHVKISKIVFKEVQ